MTRGDTVTRGDAIVPGAIVTYRDVNLRYYRGVVVSRDDGNRTIVIVQWYGVAAPSVEWAPNLMVRS